MGQSLKEIAQQLRDTDKKVQLIYAFNGVGKTRLSREFKELIAPKDEEEHDAETPVQILYYNAFTEDLFYWDNDLDEDKNRKLMIRPNSFTSWVLRMLKEQGQENNISKHFQHYTSDKLTPMFDERFSEIIFSIARGDDTTTDNIKISKGEESCLIWCVFYSLLEQVIDVLNIADPNERETPQFNDLQYVFIDDPVSSLDENHLIELAVNIAELIKSSESKDLKFIITTHNPLFYNVLYNEFQNSDTLHGYKPKHSIKYRLEKMDDGTYNLPEQSCDSPFSYHLLLLKELEKAIETNEIKKYHYNFLRQILEKTSTFLGYEKWKNLLPKDEQETYYYRIINLCSHGKHSGEETALIDDNSKRVLGFLVEYIKKNYHFYEQQPNK